LGDTLCQPGQGAYRRADVHGNSADVFVADLALAGVSPGAHLNAERLHRVAASKTRQLRPDDGVVRIKQGKPPLGRGCRTALLRHPPDRMNTRRGRYYPGPGSRPRGRVRRGLREVEQSVDVAHASA